MTLKYRYTGDGAFLPGVPARDLSEDDVAALDDAARASVEENAALGAGAPKDEREALQRARIYEAVEAAKAARRATSEEE